MVFIGSFIEEALSPIPSFVVLIPAGAAAGVQELGWWHIIILGFASSTGRILASMLLYFVADKGEDRLFKRGRRLFGVKHAKLEAYGRRFSKSTRGWWALFSLNAIPVLPTSLLSLACGFIKVDFRMFVTASFLGAAVSAMSYLSAGYFGLQAAQAVNNLELFGQVSTVVLLAILLGWLIYIKIRRTKRNRTG